LPKKPGIGSVWCTYKMAIGAGVRIRIVSMVATVFGASDLILYFNTERRRIERGAGGWREVQF